MNRTDKFLQKLNRHMRDRVEVAMLRILSGELRNLDIQPLEGFSDTFRCRIGNVRLIFQRFGIDRYGIVDIGFRKDVYKRLKR